MSDKLNLEEKELLLSPDYDSKVTKKQDTELMGKILRRFSYCMDVLFEKFKIDHVRKWYDFDNGGDDGNGDFDRSCYLENIGYTGEYIYSKLPGWNEYSESIPTAWLWTDFESDLDNFIAEQQKLHDEKAQQKRIAYAESKNKKAALIESIKNKLTKEELSVIKFKK